MATYRRLQPGEVVQKGTVVTLFLGTGDQRREIEWFQPEEAWVIPEAENGYWYGVDAD